MKKRKLTLLTSLLLLGLSSCNALLEAPATFDPWDKLSGGKEAIVGSLVDLNDEDYTPSINIDNNLLNTNEEGSIVVNLSNLTSTQYTITKAGKYSFTGNYNGSIVVEAKSVC